ncbi:hypothetical protein CR513_43866, partial [Mucuna pruriens]
MDAYSRYNQIRMHQHDEAKTAFITNSGTFCYKNLQGCNRPGRGGVCQRHGRQINNSRRAL